MSTQDLNHAIDLIKLGDNITAKKLLMDLLRKDPKNEAAWLWLASCVKTNEHKVFCLKKALEINPKNEKVKQALGRFEHPEEPPILKQSRPIKSNIESKPKESIPTQKSDNKNVPPENHKNVITESVDDNLKNKKSFPFPLRYVTSILGFFVVIGTFFTWAQKTTGNGFIPGEYRVLESYSGLTQLTGILAFIAGLLIIIMSIFILTKPGDKSAPLASTFAIIAFLIILFSNTWSNVSSCVTEEICIEIGKGGGCTLAMISLFLVFISGLLKNPL